MSTIAKCLRNTDCDVDFSFLLSGKKANTNKGRKNLFTSRSLVPGYELRVHFRTLVSSSSPPCSCSGCIYIFRPGGF